MADEKPKDSDSKLIAALKDSLLTDPAFRYRLQEALKGQESPDDPLRKYLETLVAARPTKSRRNQCCGQRTSKPVAEHTLEKAQLLNLWSGYLGNGSSLCAYPDEPNGAALGGDAFISLCRPYLSHLWQHPLLQCDRYGLAPRRCGLTPWTPKRRSYRHPLRATPRKIQFGKRADISAARFKNIRQSSIWLPILCRTISLTS